MIQIPFIPAEAALAVLWLAVRAGFWLRKKHIDVKREAVLLLLFFDLAVLLRLTFFPLYRINGRVQPLVFYADGAFPFRVNLIPFLRLRDYSHRRDLLLNVLGNAALFVPSGIVLPVVFPRLDRLGKVLLAGAGLSLAIELLQLPFSVRSTDVDDLIQNCAGLILGYGLYALARRLKRKKTKRP